MTIGKLNKTTSHRLAQTSVHDGFAIAPATRGARRRCYEAEKRRRYGCYEAYGFVERLMCRFGARSRDQRANPLPVVRNPCRST